MPQMSPYKEQNELLLKKILLFLFSLNRYSLLEKEAEL